MGRAMDRYFPTFMWIGRTSFRLSRRLGRGLLRLWPWSAGVLAVLLIAHTTLNILAGRELVRELAKIKASGAPVTLAEAAPPPVPESKNAAIVYQRAFGLLPSREEGSPFQRALALVDPGRWATAAPATESEAVDFIRQHDGALDLLRQGAAMPRARYPVDWQAGASALFPHLPRIRQSTWLLRVDAMLKSRRGDATGAIDDIQVMLTMADSVTAEPALISQLVRYACQYTALDTLNKAMNTSPPAIEDCRRLHHSLAAIQLMGPFTHAMQGERAVGVWSFGQVRRDMVWAIRLAAADGGADDMPESLFRSGPIRFVWSPVLKKDEVCYLRYMQRQIALSRKPYDANAHDALDQWLRRTPWYAFVTRATAPVFARAGMRRDEIVARIGLAQWALALRVYQVKIGHYPGALSDVSEVVDWSLPDDPFSGRAFVYGREGDGYLLYSLGPNRRDDGSQELSRDTGAAYDIVWRMTR